MVLSAWSIEIVSEDMSKMSKIFPNFPRQLDQGPPFSSEIRPCMHNHLVDLEAVQTGYSLQNGFAGVSLNSHGDAFHADLFILEVLPSFVVSTQCP